MVDQRYGSETSPATGLGGVRPAGQVNQRRYEAVRAYVLEGAPLAEAAARFGYSPLGAGVAGPRLPRREAGAVRRAGQARPQERAEEGRRPRPGHRAAPARACRSTRSPPGSPPRARR